MKVISKKVFEVTLLAPETEEEDQAIKRTIREVESEKQPLDGWTVVDNRSGDPEPR